MLNLAKLTKAQSRKRLFEARNKIVAVFVDGDSHLSNSDLNKLLKMRFDITAIIGKLK